MRVAAIEGLCELPGCLRLPESGARNACRLPSFLAVHATSDNDPYVVLDVLKTPGFSGFAAFIALMIVGVWEKEEPCCFWMIRGLL